MARIKGSYKSLVRGVSEQVPHDRIEGQHYNQVNFISDPIRGLVRRRGSSFKSKLLLGTEAPNANALKAMRSMHEHTFSAQGQQYAVFYNTRAPDPGSPANMPAVYCVDKDTEQLLPVEHHDSLEAALAGITSCVSLGRFIVMGRNGFVPTYDSSDRVEETASRAAVWVRGGAYSRTYSVTVNGTAVTHTTMSSYYQGTLNTSDISASDDEYQKKVNDAVHAYNTAVNQHIADAQASIQPENIAQALRDLLDAIPGVTATRQGSHVVLDGVTSVSGNDGGDSTFLRIAHRKVGNVDELTRRHWVGTTIAVEITEDDVYYVRADPKEEGTNGWQEVIWREGPGVETTPTSVFLIGTIHDGKLIIADTPEKLEAVIEEDVPKFQPSESGDPDTNPLPDFFERPISYMTLFQDRLLVCSGANVFMSRSGDYFNFFRKSVLRVNNDDPIEVYALGAEDDTIRGGSIIDRNLILLGERYHYAVPGRDAISPNNAVISIQSAHEGTTDAQPKPLANLLFYSQFQGGLTKLHQAQTGAFADTLNTFSVTQQITRYIMGRPRQLVTSSQPNMVLMSTDASDTGLYVFTFLDAPNQEERLFDSWSRWEWDPALGTLIGMSESDAGVYVLTARECADGWYAVIDEFSRDSSAPDTPYLDSGTEYVDREEWAEPVGGDKFAVLRASHPRKLFGKPLDEAEDVVALSGVEPEHLCIGVEYESFYEPTAPYPRDRQDNPLLAGRTILTSMAFILQASAGIRVSIAGRNGVFDRVILDEAGFRLNDPLAVLGAVPVLDRRVSCYVGKEIREHRLRVASRTWTPLNIATVEWGMQTFNR